MTRTQPKYSTIFSLSLFLVMVFFVLFMLVHSFLESPYLWWLKAILSAVLLVIGMLVLGKVFQNVKYISVAKGRFLIRSPLTFSKKSYTLDELKGWQENVVKTRKSEFRELSLVFVPKYVVKVSNKEHKGYDDLRQYLVKKCAKKKVKEAKKK